MKPIIVVLTCEHAVNTIPADYAPYFQGQDDMLNSHLGYDIGAQWVARTLQSQIHCDYVEASVSRLLIDCNRSLENPGHYSTLASILTETQQKHIEDHYYKPYRQEAMHYIAQHIAEKKQVLHLSIHSFTPIFAGKIRNAALGLLYDSKRHGEREVAREWRTLLMQKEPFYRVRMNYPYLGTSDGFTQSLRHLWHEKEYLGLELEINQALLKDVTPEQQAIKNSVAQTITESVQELLELLSV